MQSRHEFEKRAEVHRLEALKKIEALTESLINGKKPGSEAAAEDGPTEPVARATMPSHQTS